MATELLAVFMLSTVLLRADGFCSLLSKHSAESGRHQVLLKISENIWIIYIYKPIIYVLSFRE